MSYSNLRASKVKTIFWVKEYELDENLCRFGHYTTL